MEDEILKKNNNIAIMGGTFDPIHYGHLVAAEAVRHEFNIDKVIFIPTGKTPHKNNDLVTSSESRYLMTVLATASHPQFHVSRMEIDRKGLSYTIDTVNQVRKVNDEDAKIYFITGADAVNEILDWKEADKLLTLCNFVAVTRPGYNKDKLSKKVSYLKEKYKSNLYFLEIPALSISSTDIRARVKDRKPIKYLLPLQVEEYIMKSGLYSAENNRENKIIKFVKNSLSEKRFKHTIGVADVAVKLAKTYGEDEDKAFIAAMLHDIAKEYSKEDKKKLCKQYQIPIDDIMKKQIDLVHSYISAEISRHMLEVDDEDILNAIRYHTFGREDMSRLEKIIYVADCIEPSREQHEELDELRNISYENLDIAMKMALEQTIKYTKNNKREVHPLSIRALKYLGGNNNGNE